MKTWKQKFQLHLNVFRFICQRQILQKEPEVTCRWFYITNAATLKYLKTLKELQKINN